MNLSYLSIVISYQKQRHQQYTRIHSFRVFLNYYYLARQIGRCHVAAYED